MRIKPSGKISECLARVADLRQRADTSTDAAAKAELRGLQLQWQAVVDSYQLMEETARFLSDVRARRAAARENPPAARVTWPTGGRADGSAAVNGASLADQLEVLVRTAVEHADGTARAAFYLADAAGRELHHIIGMPPAYARCVDGFAIGQQSLACGLAAATRRPIITPDVSEEPLWRPWLWLAEEFDYRACWSFPVTTSAGKVLGSFAMYYAKPRDATPRDLDLATVLTRTAATIIARH
jgi:hypothetical protein